MSFVRTARRWITLSLVLAALGMWSRPVQAQGAVSSLEQFLKQVPDNAISRTVLWYGSLSDLEKIQGIQIKSDQDVQKLPAAQRAAYFLEISTQFYYSAFSGLAQAASWATTFGINSFAIERELTIGVSPNWYGLLAGNFSVDQINAALQKLGYQSTQVSSPAGSVTLHSLGADNSSDPNNPAQQLANSAYNRLIISANQIAAAPSTALIQTAISSGNTLAANPDYAAVAKALEDAATVPNTSLISAALYDGVYLNSKVLTANPIAASGLSGASATQLRTQLGLQNPLPLYKTVGFGYRLGTQSRDLVVVLAYPDANTANQAKTTLADRLSRYASLTQPAQKMFADWAINVVVTPGANGVQLVIATMQFPAATDMAWLQLLQNKDIAFLAAAQ